MSRTTLLKLLYFALFAASLVTMLYLWQRFSTPALIVIVILLLVPGRVQGVVYRNLFRGLRLLNLGEPAESLAYTRQSLDDVRRQPWRKWFLWLTASVYTLDAEAMALNNLGVAHLELGEFDQAKFAFNSALAIDPKYPLPYYNLAVERSIAGDSVEAERLAAEAVRLGYQRSAMDRVIHESVSLLARVEGRGRMPRELESNR